MKTLTRKLKISRVWIERKMDREPDLSFYGHYHNHLSEKSNHFTIDRATVKDLTRSEYRYFTPGSVEDFDPDASWLQPKLNTLQAKKDYWFGAMIQNAEQDYNRMEAYKAGQWHMIGIIAKCEIVSPAGIVQTLRSGWLWSVESDSGKEYLASIEAEQLSELRGELESMGLGNRAIAHAFRKVEEAE